MIIAAGTLGADLIVVRAWELMSLVLLAVGIGILRRKDNPVYWGVFASSALVLLFDWIWNRNWFGSVSYSDHFIQAWGARGEIEPISLALVYCFFFGLPMILLLERRAWLDLRLGRRQWPLLFVMFAVPQMPFEILAAEGLHLWQYHQVSPWVIAGVPWSNAFFSGMLGVGFYAAGRLALRWTWAKSAVLTASRAVPKRAAVLVGVGASGAVDEREFHVADPVAVNGAPVSDRERWWRSFATTIALGTLVLTATTYAFLPFYLLAEPWAPVVPPL